jgi:hypothetical protein
VRFGCDYLTNTITFSKILKDWFIADGITYEVFTFRQVIKNPRLLLARPDSR